MASADLGEVPAPVAVGGSVVQEVGEGSMTLALWSAATVGTFGIVLFVFFDRLKVRYYRWRIAGQLRELRQEQLDDFYEN
jgi:hypothetical protein